MKNKEKTVYLEVNQYDREKSLSKAGYEAQLL